MSRHAVEARCSAHGRTRCPWCSLIHSDDLAAGNGSCPSCGTFGATGMHWDTCPRRVRSWPADVTR